MASTAKSYSTSAPSASPLRLRNRRAPADPAGRARRGRAPPAVRRLARGRAVVDHVGLAPPGYAYDRLHFALRFFLELKLLAASDAADGGQAALASPACELDYALMALAQHYGLPSHGLDITTNPEVAVWFATNLLEIADGRAGYTAMSADDWPEHVDDWPVVFVHQAVTHPLRGSLHDCHELDAFGFGALRPERQSARFFLGGHSDHQNRIAESVVCVLRLRPADYDTGLSFDHLFPPPDEDAGYQVMLEFAEFAGLTSDTGVLRFH